MAIATSSYRPYYLEIRGELKLCEASPLHVGAGEEWSLVTDAPVLRDPADHRPYIPGSSLRGVLRGFLERESRLLVGGWKGVFDSLFGHAPGKGESEGHSFLGRLTVFDACCDPKDQGGSEVRDHVKVEPETGAAADQGKFDAEAIFDASFALRLIYEGGDDGDQEIVLLRAALRALEDGELRVGAKGGWGYGKLVLSHGWEWRSFRRNDPSELAKYLKRRLEPGSKDEGEWKIASGFPSPAAAQPAAAARGGDDDLAPRSILEFELRIQCEGPVLVKSPVPPEILAKDELDRLEGQTKSDANRWWEVGRHVADHVPLVSAAVHVQPYLPGSSLRGVLRSQAMRICRSQAAETSPGERDWLWKRLFGTAKGGSKGVEDRKGCIEVGDGRLHGDPQYVYLDHVAIDRITNFAADRKKFSACALESPAFDLTVRLVLERGQKACAALFAFLLRDLGERGKLWLGSGTTRGYGMVASSQILSFRANLVKADWPAAPGGAEENGRVRFSLPEDSEAQSNGILRSDLGWLWKALDGAWGAACEREGGA